ncbi:MAG TPA: DUF2970 domain-containing protein, partial [Candidatus Acidoferrum sp.]|nr:DUF2970 domain-containing protein [Candidatus Acidoferrum sp.]
NSTSQQPGLGESDKPTPSTENISFLRAMLSVIQASFGVQNRSNRERDFTQGKLWIFIVAALIFTAAFVLTIAGVVTMVLSNK